LSRSMVDLMGKRFDIYGSPRSGRAAGIVGAVSAIFSYILVLAGLFAIISGIWATIEWRNEYDYGVAVQRIVDRNESLAQTFEEYALRTLQGADYLTRQMVVSLKYDRPKDLIQRALEAGIIENTVYLSLSVQDEHGNVLATTRGDVAAGFNYSDRWYFQEARRSTSDKIIISPPIRSRLTGLEMIPIARRITKPDGSFGGLTLVEVSLQAFTAGYRNLGLKGDDYIALIGLDGIARSARVGVTEQAGRDFGNSNVLAALRQSANGRFLATANSDAVTRYVSYRTLIEYPFVVAVGAGAQEALAEYNKRRSQYIAAGVISSLLASVFAITILVVLWLKDQAHTRLEASEARLQEIATHDRLTMLANRTLLDLRAAELIADAKNRKGEVACLFIDLDKFSAINDAYGHLVGDEVLKRVGNVTEHAIGRTGIVGRVGGDEFVALLPVPEDSEREGVRAAIEVATALSGIDYIDGKRVDVRGSIGISRFPHDGDSLQHLTRCADAAMLESKAERRSKPCLFTQKMNRESDKRLRLRTELDDALELGQLEVFYQPKVCLATLRPVGAEALIRWRHPIRGLIPPATFIPVAEESGQIVAIGAWVLNKVCEDWQRLGCLGFENLHVAVNISALQFRQPDIAVTIANALKASGLFPSRLELELTESMVADDSTAMIERLDELKRMGVRLALDDFGTGYSNMQHLRNLPLDVLKIDRSFVSDIPQSANAAAIARAVIGLGNSLNLLVVAEGVETFAQQTFLASAGCQLAQGYRFSEPRPFEDVKTWLIANRDPVATRAMA
jgi:diguanylate cyclase (GGDEF)-like protein